MEAIAADPLRGQLNGNPVRNTDSNFNYRPFDPSKAKWSPTPAFAGVGRNRRSVFYADPNSKGI